MFELLFAALPAAGLLTTLALAVAVWVVATVVAAVAVPRSRSIGGRSRQHAVQLRWLPASTHPDAAGHTRSRAPGLAAQAA